MLKKEVAMCARFLCLCEMYNFGGIVCIISDIAELPSEKTFPDRKSGPSSADNGSLYHHAFTMHKKLIFQLNKGIVN
jgi:hypothetical protein